MGLPVDELIGDNMVQHTYGKRLSGHSTYRTERKIKQYLCSNKKAATLTAKSIKKSKVICYVDLVVEVVFKFYMDNFTVIVVVDSVGNNLYKMESPKYAKL
jgi:fumarate hydratase subunit beta